MKSIAALLFLTFCTTLGLHAQNTAIEGNFQEVEIPSGMVSSVAGNWNVIYLRSFGTLTVVQGNYNLVFAEADSSVLQVEGNGNRVIYDAEIPEDVVVIRPGESINFWAYFGQWPWVYVADKGWYYLEPSLLGLWGYPNDPDNPVMLFLAPGPNF